MKTTNEPMTNLSEVKYPFRGEPMANLRWIGVDLDDTLAHAVWPDKGIGRPMWDNIQKLHDLLDKHPDWRAIIFTARAWEDYPVIEAWLDLHGVRYRRIFCGKPVLRAMIDDKGIPADAPDWNAAVENIGKGQQ